MLQARDVRLSYGHDPVLLGADLAVEPGESVALVGPSGAGKSSLLYCLAGILVPDGGSVTVDGQEVSRAPADARAAVRRERMGFVFQFAELVPELSLRENVELPLRLLGTRQRDAAAAAGEVMRRLGIGHVADHRPDQVSGGQAQRAAVARAVVHSPGYVLADEPTGSLDRASGEAVLGELLALARERCSAVVLVTHDPQVAAATDRRVEVVDGRCRDRTAPR